MKTVCSNYSLLRKFLEKYENNQVHFEMSDLWMDEYGGSPIDRPAS